jgi:hypothetical protein
MSFSRNTDAISMIDFWNLLVISGYIPKGYLAMGAAAGACHGMSIMAIIHFQNGKKGLNKLNHRLHILNNYAKLSDNFKQFKLDLENAKLLQIQKNSTNKSDELIEIDILLQNCALSQCLYFYNQLLKPRVFQLFKQSTKIQNPLTAFSLVNSISGENQSLVKAPEGNFLNCYSQNELTEMITLLKNELSNTPFQFPVHFITSTRYHDVCFSYLPENKQWAYFGIREKIAMIPKNNELVTYIWNNMTTDKRADIGIEIYLAKTDVQLFQQCSQELKKRKNWITLQTISISSVNLAVVGSKFSHTDNVRKAVACHSFFRNNQIPVSLFFIFCLVMAATDINAFAKTGSLLFALLWASINCETDNRLNNRITESSLLKEIESCVEPERHQLQNRI